MNQVRKGEFVRVHAGDFEALLAENRRLYVQVTETQAANAALLERTRTAEEFVEARDHYREGLAEVLRRSREAGRGTDDPVVDAALSFLGMGDDDYAEEIT